MILKFKTWKSIEDNVDRMIYLLSSRKDIIIEFCNNEKDDLTQLGERYIFPRLVKDSLIGEFDIEEKIKRAEKLFVLSESCSDNTLHTEQVKLDCEVCMYVVTLSVWFEKIFTKELRKNSYIYIYSKDNIYERFKIKVERAFYEDNSFKLLNGYHISKFYFVISNEVEKCLKNN